MHPAIRISGVIAIIIFMGNICFGKMELARDGRTDYAIITSTNATPAEQLAAQELSAYLVKVTGARFSVMSETNPALPARAVYVGWTDFAGKQGIGVKSLGAEEWIIKSFGENLVLTGGRPRGALYAVYEFLEQEIGCHWLDEFTESVPSKPELKLNDFDTKGRPAFWDRKIYTGITALDGTLMSLFNVRNKDTVPTSAQYGFGNKYGSPGACHTFYAYSKDWQTNYPEYLAMNAKGERVRSTSGGGPGQICLTNPESRKLLLEKLRQYIITDREKAAKAGSPPPRIYAVEQNDNGLICQCPECKALREREGENSGPLIDMVNYLADGVRNEFPDVLVDTFAYGSTLKPPRTIKPRDNVIIRVAQLNARPGTTSDGPEENGNRLDVRPDYFRPMTNAINRSCYETFMTWSKITKHISYWDYWVQFLDKFQTPYINLVCIKSDLKLFLDSNVEAMFVECEYADTSSFFALKRWVGLKLMQDPRQPAEPLVEIFMSGYYGPAASKMSAYLAYMEQRINAVPATEKLSVPEAQNRPYLDLEFYVTSERLLDEAEALCGTNQPALLHVQRERIPVDSGLLGMWASLQSKLPAGKTMPFDHAAILKRYEAMRLAQMEAFYTKKQLPKGKVALETEVRKFRDNPLIEKIKAGKQPSAPVLRIPRLGDAAAAGDLAKVDWTKATTIRPWRTLYGIERPQRQIKGALAQDGKYLYFSLEETIELAKLSSAADVFSGDDWELFFAAQRSKPPYRQIGVNPDGKHSDYEWTRLGLGTDCAAWTNNAVVKSAVSNGQWQVKISVPLANLIPNGVKAGQPFYMNIFRGGADPICWSPVFDEGFHDLDHLAELTLE